MREGVVEAVRGIIRVFVFLASMRRVTVSDTTVQNGEITLYTGEYCPYCRRVKKELDRLDLGYSTVDADADGRTAVVQLSGQRAIPILTIGDEVLVDSTHIIRELRKRYAS